MDILAEKKLLRARFKQVRKNLSSEEISRKSQLIADNFIQNLLPKIYPLNSQKIFSLYLDSNNEVQTSGISDFFTENNIKFSYPKITALKAPLEFITYQKGQKFISSELFPKITEPNAGERVFPDIVILPLLAFDQDMSRLGMGGGFFDRTIEMLKNGKTEIITIGLAYHEQRLEGVIPCENTDQSLDFIVSEKGIFSGS